MRKRIKNAMLILLFLILSALLVFLVYLHFFSSDDKDISGEWTTEVDMTEQAAVTALVWLQDIEAVSVSMEDVESRMGGLTVEVDLSLEKISQSEGTFRCYIVPESYEDCHGAAYEAFAAVFRELLAERLRMAGYAGDTGDEAVEALVTETFGMSTVSYLMTCIPDLLPPLEELQDRYDGSGAYEAVEGILTRQFEAGGAVPTKAERYIVNETGLILTEMVDSENSEDYPVIYESREMPSIE